MAACGIEPTCETDEDAAMLYRAKYIPAGRSQKQAQLVKKMSTDEVTRADVYKYANSLLPMDREAHLYSLAFNGHELKTELSSLMNVSRVYGTNLDVARRIIEFKASASAVTNVSPSFNLATLTRSFVVSLFCRMSSASSFSCRRLSSSACRTRTPCRRCPCRMSAV